MTISNDNGLGNFQDKNVILGDPLDPFWDRDPNMNWKASLSFTSINLLTWQQTIYILGL